MKVGRVVIGEQGKYEENYTKFMSIVKEKNINIVTVNKGDRIELEKLIYIDVLWPIKDKMVKENILNNNSLVCNLHYKDFSMIFTGDIENVAEKQILTEYQNCRSKLRANILKVAHHGSKTSSRLDFIQTVNPQIAVIGVGEENKFGHPSRDTVNNLKSNGIKIYRTDFMGEITICVDSSGRTKIKQHITSNNAQSSSGF